MTNEQRERSYEHYKQWQMNKSRYHSECVGSVLLFGFGFFFVIEHWEGMLVGLGIAFIIGALFLFIKNIRIWNRKNAALNDLKKMAEEMGAKDIEIDCERGEISFVADSDTIDDKIDAVNQALLDRGMRAKMLREKVSSTEGNMVQKSTDTGYTNKNNQRNAGRTDEPGTDNNQFFYKMECLNCGYEYRANGSDIWQRKCPKCQGGRA